MANVIPTIAPPDIRTVFEGLHHKIRAFLGTRLTYLYAYLISKTTASPIYTAYFRKILLEHGEDPSNIEVTEDELMVLLFGSKIASEQGKIPQELYKALSHRYTQEQIILLVSFAGQLIAATILNNTLEVEIEDSLKPYVMPRSEKTELCLV